MAYELHIQRPDHEISLDEWCSLVQGLEFVRLTDGDAVAVNPQTGEEIRIPETRGYVEVLCEYRKFLWFGRQQKWQRAFRFSHGRVTFRATSTIESPRDSVHRAAARLATALRAQIVGDGGEVYDWKRS